MRKALLVSFLFLATCFAALAQQTVTGKVTDANGLPLAGITVQIKGTSRGTQTVADGSFSLVARTGDELQISGIGYATQTVKIGTGVITVTLLQSAEELSQVVLVGTRTTGRAKTETPVPVDVIRINQAGLPTARMDLTSILNVAAPSFNYNKQSGADGADHIDLGTLRGLGPDQSLVLINGKRRHQTAFVGLFGTRGRGNSGADLNGFPQIAVDRIEILRDGASAQYGSDAMAGVINVILKKDVGVWTINTGWAGYYDNKFNARQTRKDNQYYYGNKIDGGTNSIAANYGVGLGKNGGFLNFSLDYHDQGKTYRQTKDTNVQKNPDALPLNTGRRAFGDGSVTTIGAMYNLEAPSQNNKLTFYSFGGYNYKSSDAYAYTRNFSGRPDRFPIDAGGNLLFEPSIMRVAVDGEVYYNPHIQTHITDASVAAGVRGGSASGWNWDFSNTLGHNNFHYYGDKTFNASLIGAKTPNHFDDGGFNFTQNTVNLDFSRSFRKVAQGMNLGLGTEFRYEHYTIYKGEEASYKGYPNTHDQAPGSQGFPGFSPADVIKAKRGNFSVYADAEINASKNWLTDFAVRFENYSDFGSVFTGKFATRYKVSGNFSLRGSVSTGFRAPSLQQINFSNTLTSFSGGNLVQSRIARNGDDVTKAAGIPDLKEETSVNTSLGFTSRPAKGLTFTLDGYMVKVKNRIVLSGLFSADDASLPTAFTDKLKALGVSTAQFFDNAVNTTNYGLDIVLDYKKSWSNGNQGFRALLTGNLQKMKVDAVHVPASLNDSYVHRKTFFSDREEAFLIASAPKAKFALSLQYDIKKLGFGLGFTYFGKMKTLGFGWTGLASQAGTGGPGDPDISGSFTGIDPYVDIDGYNDQVHVVKEEFIYTGKITTDIFASYKFSKKVSLFVGADNLFNVHPDYAAVKNARYESFDNETGGPWESVQMGFNGMRLFTKLAFTLK
ncbi:MAG: TonB-dependent receptor [Chitinophagaceae bacterium]